MGANSIKGLNKKIIITGIINMESQKENKNRVVVILRADEKKALKMIAEDDGRSMSSYLRHLLLTDIDDKIG